MFAVWLTEVCEKETEVSLLIGVYRSKEQASAIAGQWCSGGTNRSIIVSDADLGMTLWVDGFVEEDL